METEEINNIKVRTTGCILTINSNIEEYKKTLLSKIEMLQRYEESTYPGLDGYYIDENDNGEFIRYDSLISLLNSDD